MESDMRRFQGPLIVLAAAFLAATLGLKDFSARASFPLTTDGSYATSPAFSGQAGTYLIELEMDVIRDKDHTSCLLGGETFGTSHCDAAPRLSTDWRLYAGNQLITEDGHGSMDGVDELVRPAVTKGRIRKDLGSVRLTSFRSYQLKIREVDVPPVLAGANPVIHVRLHPTDVKLGLGRMLGGLVLALLLGIAGLVWLCLALTRRASGAMVGT
jgi:hypothetical protein